MTLIMLWAVVFGYLGKKQSKRTNLNRDSEKIAQLRSSSRELKDPSGLQPLINRLAQSRVVLLGEASHGTHEYYTWRAEISKRLIREHGFNCIAVEGDWPDFYRVNRFVKGYENSHHSAVEVLREFNRWPTWMWANWEIEALVNWLRLYNGEQPANQRVGVYGLDVYSLWESMEAIINYLRVHDPGLVPTAKRAISCFEPFGDEMGMAYARSLQSFLPKSCKEEVVRLLQEITSRAQTFNTDLEASLNMEQNAYIARNAEAYYRAMVQVNQNSWNIRDLHMMDTLKRLLDFHGPHCRIIVWEHNTHVGDARATNMLEEGSLNLGQLVREQLASLHPVIVGFGSYQGKVLAGAEWGAPMRIMHVPEAMEGSWEYLMHATGKGNQLVLMEELETDGLFQKRIPHRAIGVVYHPHYEQFGNYVPSVMPERYDAFIHLDQTEGLHAMEVYVDRGQLPETYPWAF